MKEWPPPTDNWAHLGFNSSKYNHGSRTKCSNMWLVYLIHPNNINATHKGWHVRCIVLVKMYGNNPKILFVKIMRNDDVRMNEFPLFSFHFLRIFLFLGVVYLLVSLLLYYSVMGLIKFLLGSVVVQ
jgi:hypothetical protein